MKIIQKAAIIYTRIKIKLLAVLSKKAAAKKAYELFCTPIVEPVKNIPAVFEKAEPLHFVLNGLNINGFRWKNIARPRILILHGFASVSYKFGDYVNAFIEKDIEVLTFDAQAHGNSDGKTIDAVDYENMILKVVELYGPVQGFMAHSFGCLALSLALENMPNDENTKAVFIAPITEITTAIEHAFAKLHLHDNALRKEFDDLIMTVDNKEPSWYSIKRALHNIKAKILWIHDEDDITAPLSDALPIKKENLPNVEFIITKGLGHRKIYHDKTIRNTIVEFLCT
jgi:pimeloyl-ACP methyl ester carboxylesterase